MGEFVGALGNAEDVVVALSGLLLIGPLLGTLVGIYVGKSVGIVVGTFVVISVGDPDGESVDVLDVD